MIVVEDVMEVILREHVDNLGRRGEIVKVADGYARNYLLPRKLALLATDGNKKQIERERAKFEVKELEEQKVAQAVADRMATVEIEIARRVGETEALYGSVTSSDIAEALAAKGFDLDRRKLQLHEPIKKIGAYDVPVKLHRDVTVQLKVRVDQEKKVVERTRSKRQADSERRRVKRGLPPQRQPGEGRAAGEMEEAEDDRFDGLEG